MSALPRRASVVVVGGGVMGASIAFHLAEAGVRDVLLLERGALAGGSTSRSAGGVRGQFSDRVNVELAARSLAAYERFADRPGTSIGLRQNGYLFLHRDVEAWRVAQEAVVLQNALGVGSVLLSADEAVRLSPAVDGDGVLGATFHARDGWCSPEDVVSGYVAVARRLGAVVVTGVEVTGVDVRDGEVAAVTTSAGPVATGVVVCAAGPWSGAVGGWVGVDLPVTPLRRQICVSDALGPAALEAFPDDGPMTIDASSTLYWHREGPGLLFGMSWRGETPGFHAGWTDAWSDDLAQAMEERAPALLDLGVAHRWTGFYETTPDHNALVGEASGVSRFLYATGFSGHGFLQGPAVGEVVRDLYLRREPVVDVSSLSADRFAAGVRIDELGIV